MFVQRFEPLYKFHYYYLQHGHGNEALTLLIPFFSITPQTHGQIQPYQLPVWGFRLYDESCA